MVNNADLRLSIKFLQNPIQGLEKREEKRYDEDVMKSIKNNRFIIKSKQRIKDHGEVFTPDFIVQEMLDLVKNETERIESRFLEPACGDGNFLAPILERKLEVVKSKYKSSQVEFERNALLAVSSIYGVELLQDNVVACIERLYKIVDEVYSKLYKEKCSIDFRKSIRFVLNRNILQGNALDLKTSDGKEHIVFSEWSPANGSSIKRRDFRFLALSNFYKPGTLPLDSVKELSDTGETVFSPMPIKEFPLKHYLKLDYEDAK